MIEYNLVGEHRNHDLVKWCISILEKNGIEKLPDINIGEKNILFKSDSLDISLIGTGKNQGYFLVLQTFGTYRGNFSSATIEY